MPVSDRGSGLVKGLAPCSPPLKARLYRCQEGATTGLACSFCSNELPWALARISCLVKTIADCFKYRNKIGLDVALEALRDCWRERRCSMDDLWHYSKVCRVANVIRPYLESLTYAS